MAVTAGATVRMRVAGHLVGEMLRYFEFQADVFIVRRDVTAAREEVWHLRSDVFPDSWNGWWVDPTFHGEWDHPTLKEWKPSPPDRH